MKHLPFLLLLVATGLCAQTSDKSAGPDGKPANSSKPPADGRVQQSIKVTDPPSTALPKRLQAEVESLQRKDNSAPASTNGVVLFTATWCGYCRQAKAYLAQSRIKFEEVDIDSPMGKAAYATYGKGGVPLLVSNGQHLRGYSELAYDYFFASQK